MVEEHVGDQNLLSSASITPSCCSQCERQTALRQQEWLTQVCAPTGEEHACFDERH